MRNFSCLDVNEYEKALSQLVSPKQHKYPLTCLISQQQVCYQQWTYFAPMLIGVIQSLELESDLKLKLKPCTVEEVNFRN